MHIYSVCILYNTENACSILSEIWGLYTRAVLCSSIFCEYFESLVVVIVENNEKGMAEPFLSLPLL